MAASFIRRIAGYRSLFVKLAVAAAFAGAVLIGGAFALVLLRGPRMWTQEHVRTFQSAVPDMPPGVAPVTDTQPLVPAGAEAAGVPNPLAPTPENTARGLVYYQYYCLFCHGAIGDGNGYVGQSYVPKPADLRTPEIQSRADGDLLRAMLLGAGHAPVLEEIVPEQHRWFLVLAMRSFAAAPPGQTPAPIALPTGPELDRTPLPSR